MINTNRVTPCSLSCEGWEILKFTKSQIHKFTLKLFVF